MFLVNNYLIFFKGHSRNFFFFLNLELWSIFMLNRNEAQI